MSAGVGETIHEVGQWWAPFAGSALGETGDGQADRFFGQKNERVSAGFCGTDGDQESHRHLLRVFEACGECDGCFGHDALQRAAGTQDESLFTSMTPCDIESMATVRATALMCCTDVTDTGHYVQHRSEIGQRVRKPS